MLCLEDKMVLAWDIKMEFHYSKSAGEWFWCSKGETNMDNWSGPCPTFENALDDAIEPYTDEG